MRLIIEALWFLIKRFIPPLIIAGVLVFVFLVGINELIKVILVGYSHEWTGFGASTIPIYSDRAIQPEKKLWDWLGLLVIPTVLAIGATLYTWIERRSERAIANQRIEEERKTAEDRAQDAALQSYLEQMSILLIDKKLRKSEEGSEVRALARSWTLTFLRRLDEDRKGILLRFLYESELIKKGESIISLKDADFSEARVSGGILFGVDLSGAILRDAKLIGIVLVDVDLSNADLRRVRLIGGSLASAILTSADLRGAKLSGASLSGADLKDARLNGADLSGADLSRANLNYARLRDADLSGADLSETILRNAIYDKVTTKWPDGFDPAAHGATVIEEL